MTEQTIVVFDGVCNFCSASVQFILRNERTPIFRFAAVQSAAGHELLVRYHIDPDDVTTFLLVQDGHAYVQSDAALRIARELRWPWRMLVVFRVVPATIRNRLYSYVARNRYRWFGRKDACMLPTPDVRHRFLD